MTDELDDFLFGRPAPAFCTIEPAPYGEECATVGTAGDYRPRMMAECVAFRDQVGRAVGPPPAGARLAVKWFPHDGGTYAEVVCYYDADLPPAEEYACTACDVSLEFWDEEARQDLAGMGFGAGPLPASRQDVMAGVRRALDRIGLQPPRDRAETAAHLDEHFSDAAAEDYCRDRLAFVSRVIASVDHPDFQAVRRGLARRTDAEACSALGIDSPKPEAWLTHACGLQERPAECLFALGRHFLLPAWFPPDLEALGLTLLSGCLQALDREIDAACVLERFLDLDPSDYAADVFPEWLAVRLRRVAAHQRRSFVHALAVALQSLGRDEDLGRLIDAFGPLD